MTRHRLVTRALAVLAIPILVAACSSGTSIPTVGPVAPAPSVAAGSAYPAGCPTTQPPALAPGDVRIVTLATPKGDIVIKIQGSLSPIATGNFVALASCGYYDGVVFHRLVPGFVIQGGDGQFGRTPNVDLARVGTGRIPYTIQDEPVTTPYGRGTVAMARTSQPNSVGSQFFIVLDPAAASALAAANTYQIIGSVTAGMDVVDAIAAMPNSGDPANEALDPVPMTKISVSTP